jgi:hypothetical protein
MKFLLKDLKENVSFKEKHFVFMKEKLIKKLRIRNKILLEDSVTFEFFNNLFLLESLTGFKTFIVKLTYKNINLKNRFLSMNVLLETLIGFKYLINYLNFLFFFTYSYTFMLNRLNNERDFSMFKTYSYTNKIFFIRIKDSYRFLGVINILYARLLHYLKMSRFMLNVYFYNYSIYMSKVLFFLLKHIKIL